MVIDGGEKTVSRWRPRTYTLFFMGWDLASLVLQAIGGAIASLGSTHKTVCQRRPSSSICLHVSWREEHLKGTKKKGVKMERAEVRRDWMLMNDRSIWAST